MSGAARTAGGLAAAALGGLLAVAAAPAGPPPGREADLSFSSFNGSYSEPGATLAPVTEGPITVQLSSPENTFVLVANRLHLTALPDGTQRARWTADFHGQGKLIADFSVAGAPGRIEDEVVVPPQSRSVEGRVRLARGDGGWVMTAVELPPSVSVEIRSRVADSLVATCEGMAILPLVRLDCGAFRASLETATVPLPAAGETYFLPDARLTAAERQRLDAYLAGR